MDIISAMDRSAMDRFSWNYADIIVVSSWKIPATFWAGKIFIYSRKFKNHAGKAFCEVVCPPPFFSGNWGRWQPFCGRIPANVCLGLLDEVCRANRSFLCPDCWQKNKGGVWGQADLLSCATCGQSLYAEICPPHMRVRVNPSPPPTTVSALGGE